MSRILGREIVADALTIAKNGTTYTSSMRFDTCTGDVGILLTTTGLMTVVITQQCSDDNKVWKDPTDGAGSATGAIEDLTTEVVDSWIVPTLAPAPYIRFKFVEANEAAGTATMIVHFAEDI